MTVTLDQTSIINIVTDALSDYLKAKLETEPTDAAKAGLVRPGNLQDDPNKTQITFLLHPGGPDHPDELNTSISGGGKIVPNTYEIGGDFDTIGQSAGGVFWKRYLDIEMKMFFPNSTIREDIRHRSNVALSRAVNAIYTWDIGKNTSVDDFGEKAYDFQVISMYLDESGGPGEFIWRGHIIYQYLTEIEAIQFGP